MRLIFSINDQIPTDYIKPLKHQFNGARSVLFFEKAMAVRQMGSPIQVNATKTWDIVMDGVSVDFCYKPRLLILLIILVYATRSNVKQIC